MENTAPVQQIPPVRSRGPIIAAVVVGILVLAGAAFAYTKLANKPAATPSPIASATPDMGGGWKTFNSQYFTLSFNVPSGFDIVDTQNEIAIATGKYEADEMGGSNAFFVLSRYQDGQTKTTTTAAVKKELTNPITSQVTIDGSTFTKIEGRDDAVVEGIAPGKVVYLIFDQSVARFYEHGPWTENADTITIGNQILSTFRFTSTIKAGWKTYTNTAYHYSMRYPANWSFANACGGEGQAVDPTISCGEAIIYSLPQVSRSALHADVVSNTGDLSAEAFAKAILKEATIIDPITTQSIAGKEATAATFTGTLKFSVDPKDRSGSLVEEKMVIIFIKLNAHDMLRIQYPKAFCSDSGCFSDERNTILKEIADSVTIL